MERCRFKTKVKQAALFSLKMALFSITLNFQSVGSENTLRLQLRIEICTRLEKPYVVLKLGNLYI